MQMLDNINISTRSKAASGNEIFRLGRTKATPRLVLSATAACATAGSRRSMSRAIRPAAHSGARSTASMPARNRGVFKAAFSRRDKFAVAVQENLVAFKGQEYSSV
jgi:hypothetical protein